MAVIVALGVLAGYLGVLVLYNPAVELKGVPATPPPPVPTLQPFKPARVLLSLSGGDYRAMLFHTGAVLRLNDLALLQRITQISSVSGGSIVAAVLGLHWHELQFEESGRASNLDTLIVPPIRRLASRRIDAPAIIRSIVTPQSAAQALADEYRRSLLGVASLGALPNTPRFVFHATDLNNGRDWIFSKERIGNSRVGYTYAPHFRLAFAVAASSAFPPFLSPLHIEVQPTASVSSRPQTQPTRIAVSDGGVSDNLGLSGVLSFDAILLSDASARTGPIASVPANWLGQLLRVIDLIYDQPGDLRTRALIERYFNGLGHGTLWAIRLGLDAYNAKRDDVCQDVVDALASLPTRLDRVDESQQKALINWGYIAASAALKYRFARDRFAPVALPYPEAPLCSGHEPGR